jgi:RHS repeat-associated protein
MRAVGRANWGAFMSVRLASFVTAVMVGASLPLYAAPLAAQQEPAPPGPRTGELVERRTASSRTIAHEDGSFTTTLFGAPVHFRDGEQWREIDTALVDSQEPGYAVRTKANAFAVHFKDQADEDFLRVDTHAGAFDFSLDSPAKARGVKRSDRSVAYQSVHPGVDLEYDLTNEGVKETLVLQSASAPTRYRFYLDPPSERVSAREDTDGGFSFTVAPAASPLLRLLPPRATDSASGEQVTAEESSNASMSVRREGNRFAIDVAVDPRWLKDPARVFPVLLDPTITVQPGVEDASFAATCSNCTPFVSDRLYIGADDTDVWRAALQFDLAGVPADAAVTEAKLGLFADGYCMTASGAFCGGTTHPIDTHKMTSAWSTSSTSGQLTFEQSPLSSFVYDPSLGDQWMNWPITDTVKGWLAGTTPNYGLLVKRNTEPLSSSGPTPPGRRYSEPSVMPKIDITYTSDAVTLAAPETLHSNGADLSWSLFAPPSGAAFVKYEVHRSASPGFAPSAATLLATLTDVNTTGFRDTTAAPSKTFAYRIVANSSASNQQVVTLPADGRASKTLQPDASGRSVFIYRADGMTNCANYGTDKDLLVGSATGSVFRSLLDFDLRDIPAGTQITDSSLTLWQQYTNDVDATLRAFRLTSRWEEGSGGSGPATCTGDGATWYDATGGQQWKTQGGDFDPTPIASVRKTAGDAPTRDVYDVTAAVQAWTSGSSPNLGLLLKTDDETLAGNDSWYYSDDYTVSPALRPKLTVSYADDSRASGPTVALSNPAPSTMSGTVPLTAAAGDDRRVDKVEFLVGTSVVGTDTTAPYEAAWNSTSVANGAHSISVRATDDAGNVTTSSPTSVTVENTAPPTTSVSAPSSGATVKGTVTVSANAGDDVAVTKVEFFVDGQRFAEDTTVPYSVSWNTLDAALPAFDGTHTLTSRVHDSSGQVTISAGVGVSVANTAGTKYQATYSTSAVPPAVVYDPAPGATQQSSGVDVTVKNTSGTSFGTDIKLGYRWFSPQQPPVVTQATPATVSLRKGQSSTIRLLIPPPALGDGVDRAQYQLQLGLYDATAGAWFADKGNAPVINPVIVNKKLSTKLGLERYYPYEGREVGAGMQHLVNAANGNSLLRWTPFQTPGRGLATVVDLTYNSLEDRSESPVGDNFSLGISSLSRFGLPLDIHPNNADSIAGRSNRWIEFTDGDGSKHRFEGKTASDGTLFWEEPAGVHLYLRQYSSTDTARKWALTRPDRVTFFYDTDGYPTSVEDANGNRISFTLTDVPAGEDPGGPKKRITKITDAAGQGTTPAPSRSYTVEYYSKDEAKKARVRGKIRRITDHTGSALELDFYDDGNLLRLHQRGGTNADGTALGDRTFVFTYTTSAGDGPAISDPDARANPNPKTANQSSRLFSVRDPRGAESTFGYYGPTSGQLRWKINTVTDRAGAVTSYGYDLTNRITTVTAPQSRVTKYGYDSTGKPTAITNPKNESTTVAWTGDFQVAKVTEPTGVFREFAYNDNGYPTDVWNELREHTQLGYAHVAVDGNDTTGKWRTGRTTPHISQLTSKTDPKGTATTSPTDDFRWLFGYDARGNLTSTTDPDGGASSTVVNADGTIASVTDANNHTTRFTGYDASGQPTAVADGLGRTTEFGYDSDGLLRWVQDPLHAGMTGDDPRGYRTYLDYDSFHRLGRQSTPKSAKAAPGVLIWTAASYDPNDNLTSTVGAHYAAQYTGSGARTSTAYDAMDRPTLTTGPDTTADPAGERTAWTYDTAGRVTSVTSPKGVKTDTISKDHASFLSYDPLDRITSQTRYDVDAAGAVTRTYTTHACYDLAGDLRSVTAPNAALTTVDCAATSTPHTTRMTYDAAHRQLTTTDPQGRKSSVSYDKNGNIETSTDAHGNSTTLRYNARNLTTSVAEPFTTGTSGRTLTTRIDYDPVGNRTRVVSPRAFDASADKSTFTEFVTSYRYDAADQLVRIELPTSTDQPQQQYVHQGYDPNGRMATTSLPVTTADPSLVGADKKTTLTLFDPGWIATSDEPGQPRLHYDYTAEGWQATRTSERAGGGLDTSRAMSWSYYLDGALKQRTDRGGQSSSYTYDPDNLLLTAREATGLTSSDESAYDLDAAYDGQNRPAKIRRKKQNTSDFTVSTLGYDLNGNTTRREDNRQESAAGALVKTGRQYTFGYDGADWLTSQIDLGDDPAGSSDDRRTTTGYTPTGWQNSRTIDKSNGAGGWNPLQTTNWTYYANGKLDTLKTTNAAGTVVESHTVGYTDTNGVYANGHRTRDTYTLQGPDSTAPCRSTACTATYTYDPRDRLIRNDDGHGTVTGYSLDTAGNVTAETRNGTTSKTYTYTGDQLATVTAGGSTQKHWYDPEGNLDCVTLETGSHADCITATGQTTSAKVVADYGYDYLDRLASIRTFLTDGTTSTADDTASYTYDALDRVTRQTEQHGTAPARTTVFDHLALTDQISREQHSTSAGPTRTKTYSYDAAGHRLGMTDTPNGGTPTPYTYGYDVHGSVSLLLNATGSASAAYGYTAYGEIDKALSKGDTNDDDPLNPYRYTGKRYDSGSGTLDMGARRFGPGPNRFLQRDQYNGALANLSLSTDPLSQNRYSLAGGNPISFIEVDGHIVTEDGTGTATRVSTLPDGTRYLDNYTPPKPMGPPTGLASRPNRTGSANGARGGEARKGDSLIATIGHGILDGAGLVPVLGEPADGLNAAWYAAEGDEVNASLSAAGAVPFAGWFATGAKVGMKAADAAKAGDDALVVRGGTNTPDRFAGGSGVTVDQAGNLHGVSVTSAPGRSLEELTQGIPNKQVGVTTVGDIRAAGGYVRPDPTPNNPSHCLIGGCSAQQFSELFTPTVKNPWK